MPLTKLQFRPGIIREITEYSNSGGWFDSDKIRFRQGYPEKIGGWLAVIKQPMQGTCRHIHQWSTLANELGYRYVGLGTSSHLYILWSENYYDITPIRSTIATLPANPFTTGSPVGSTSMTVNVPSHGARVSDWVQFSGATAFDAYTAAQLNQQYQIVASADANTITITMPVGNKTAGLAGGGTIVSASFLISSGLDDAVIGQGWGIPTWGGTGPGIGTPPSAPAATLAAGGTLVAGTAYYYMITAVVGGNESGPSAQVTATPTAGNQTINLTWSAVVGATGYKVYRTTTSNNYLTPALAGSPAVTSFSDTGVALSIGVPPGTGWGVAFDSTKLYPVDPTVNQLRLWDLDNFGQDLVANIRAGKIYYWHQPGGLSSPAVPLTQTITVGGVTYTPDAQVPATARQILVSPNDRHLIAMGCEDITPTGITATPDPLLIRWSTEEDAYTWNPLRTNTAGGQRLSAGSYIIAGMRTSQQILIWTDLGLWAMTYIGTPYVFGFQSIAEGLSIIGPNAMINTGSIVCWMDRGIFYAYTGQVQELPCALKDFVFNDFNYLQGYKVYAGHNHAFAEIMWFYPSANSLENDRYVIYNYGEQLWSMGTIERTAWLDMGRANYPIASDRKNQLLYYHEYGDDDNGAAMPAYVESADVDAEGGDHYLFLSRLIPDIAFRGTAAQQSVGITVYARSAPGRQKVAAAQLEVSPNTPEQYIRVRERQISFRIESDALGVGWRLGTIRTDMQPDGKR